MIAAAAVAAKCRACKSTDVCVDREAGDEVCRDCGLVSGMPILDERRAFVDAETGFTSLYGSSESRAKQKKMVSKLSSKKPVHMSGVGADDISPESASVLVLNGHGGNGSMTISPKACDTALGGGLGDAQGRQASKRFIEACIVIRGCSHQLSLPSSVEASAVERLERLDSRKRLPLRKGSLLGAAALYQACLEETSCARTYSEIAAVASSQDNGSGVVVLSKGDVGKAQKALRYEEELLKQQQEAATAPKTTSRANIKTEPFRPMFRPYAPSSPSPVSSSGSNPPLPPPPPSSLSSSFSKTLPSAPLVASELHPPPAHVFSTTVNARSADTVTPSMSSLSSSSSHPSLQQEQQLPPPPPVLSCAKGIQHDTIRGAKEDIGQEGSVGEEGWRLLSAHRLLEAGKEQLGRSDHSSFSSSAASVSPLRSSSSVSSLYTSSEVSSGSSSMSEEGEEDCYRQEHHAVDDRPRKRVCRIDNAANDDAKGNGNDHPNKSKAAAGAVSACGEQKQLDLERQQQEQQQEQKQSQEEEKQQILERRRALADGVSVLPEDLVPRFANALKLPKPLTKLAVAVAANLGFSGLLDGKAPQMQAACALYLSHFLFPRCSTSKQAIATAAEVYPQNLGKCHKMVAREWRRLLPIETISNVGEKTLDGIIARSF